MCNANQRRLATNPSPLPFPQSLTSFRKSCQTTSAPSSIGRCSGPGCLVLRPCPLTSWDETALSCCRPRSAEPPATDPGDSSSTYPRTHSAVESSPALISCYPQKTVVFRSWSYRWCNLLHTRGIRPFVIFLQPLCKLRKILVALSLSVCRWFCVGADLYSTQY